MTLVNDEPSHLGCTFEAGKRAQAALAQQRSTMCFGVSLKRAVRMGWVRISKVIGSDKGPNNYDVLVVKTHRLEAKLKA